MTKHIQCALIVIAGLLLCGAAETHAQHFPLASTDRLTLHNAAAEPGALQGNMGGALTLPEEIRGRAPVRKELPFVVAQSDSVSEHVSLTAVHQYVAGDVTPHHLPLPANILMSQVYRQIVESMLRGSPTFRRQCLRIANEPWLTVHLSVSPSPRRSDARAVTRVTRNAKGHLAASVHIAPRNDIEELIAHEFEHIIEQLDGVNLAARAALSNTGVTASQSWPAVFETTRAQRMGIKAVSELRR